MEKVLAIRQFIPASLREDEPALNAFIDDIVRRAAEQEGGRPVMRSVVIEWHQVQEGDFVPIQIDGTSLVGIGDWRMFIAVMCEIEDEEVKG